jgi:aerobic-type carbon monoxide dehydrogenase small subunit (CoxS/CutS family)
MATTPLTLNLNVNGAAVTVTVADSLEPLLYVLRNQVGTQGVKFGCGVAQCGACTVILKVSPRGPASRRSAPSQTDRK